MPCERCGRDHARIYDILTRTWSACPPRYVMGIDLAYPGHVQVYEDEGVERLLKEQATPRWWVPLVPERYGKSFRSDVRFEPWTARIAKRLGRALAELSKVVGQ